MTITWLSVSIHWIVPLKVVHFTTCKSHHNKADHNRKHSATPRLQAAGLHPPPHWDTTQSLQDLKCFKLCGFPASKGDFWLKNQKRLLRKTPLSNAGIKQLPHEGKCDQEGHSFRRGLSVAAQRMGVDKDLERHDPNGSHLQGPQSSSLVSQASRWRLQTEEEWLAQENTEVSTEDQKEMSLCFKDGANTKPHCVTWTCSLYASSIDSTCERLLSSLFGSNTRSAGTWIGTQGQR